MPQPDVDYVATIVITRTTRTPRSSSDRGYSVSLSTPADVERKIESFRVPAVRAKELDRLNEKINQYLGLVTDEDFGDDRTMRADS